MSEHQSSSDPAGPAPAVEGGARPLCVDLDGTFLKVDTLWEFMVAALQQTPLRLAGILPRFARPADRARAKTDLTGAVRVDLASLPVRPEVRELIRRHRATGGAVFLVTASPQAVADQVAAVHGCFDAAWGSSRGENLKGPAKAAFLVARFGAGNFDYVGDSTADLAVWRVAARQVAIAPGGRLPPALADAALPVEPLPVARPPHAWLRALRPHQWAKNLLVFVPLLTAHRVSDPAALGPAAVAAAAVSLIASALYLLNDIFDAPHDRRHRQKQHRPIATGDLTVLAAGGLALLLLALSVPLGAVLPVACAGWLLTYALVSAAYTLLLKRLFLLDAVVLVVLHLARIMLGCAATGIVCSRWLLGFAALMLGSLALLKRYVEIMSVPAGTAANLPGRGAYSRTAGAFIRAAGLALGWLATLVFSCYLFSDQAHLLYRRPLWLAGAMLLLGAWITRAWRLAAQRRLPGDPVMFALTDPASYLLGVLTLASVWLAR